jgi:hypothetical protein
MLVHLRPPSFAHLMSRLKVAYGSSAPLCRARWFMSSWYWAVSRATVCGDNEVVQRWWHKGYECMIMVAQGGHSLYVHSCPGW